MKVARAGFIAALAVVASSVPASAQRIFGSVVRGDGATPAAGAIVIAVDSAGVVMGRELATARGDFVLPVRHAGRYTVTATRLGDVPGRMTLAVEPGKDLRVKVAMGPAAPPPPAVTIRSGEVCNLRADSASAVSRAWAQFQVVLASAQIAVDSKVFTGTWRESERTLDRAIRDTIARKDTSVTLDLEQSVFATISPDSAREFGFVVESEGGVRYHLPDLAILSSPRFTERRCFSFDPPPATQPGWVGLHFRSPDYRIGVSDIEGTIWLDRATFEPRGLGFRYANLPPDFNPAEAGGTLRFRLLPTGHWIIEEWTLRAPAGAFRRLFSYDSRGRPSGFATRLTLDGVRILTARLMELELNGSPIFRRQ